ncbi:26.2 kDa heat shock protein, mitochondrial-like [Lolium rigidum]|uniref:26.2 kDa heat shock protein, mitochondrial-like n=1 Tax=Lolium rigidum TaxID=89674 RepID=UPI001F5DC45E|nr:26.2 kDa heat shock protein, mitochondrial-like [Lolium rigidum]
MASAVAPSCPALANVKKMLAEPSATGAPVAYYALSPAAGRRLSNTQGKDVRRYEEDDDTKGESGRARDSDMPSFFSHDVFDRFAAPTSLGRLLGLMEDAVAAPGLGGRGWSVAKEDDEAVYLKVPMPGFGKEHVKVSAEQNSLVIKGEGEKDAWNSDKDDNAVPRFNRRIELPANAYKMDKIKAEMKNGVLMVTVPKLKKEERKDVFQITVE